MGQLCGEVGGVTLQGQTGSLASLNSCALNPPCPLQVKTPGTGPTPAPHTCLTLFSGLCAQKLKSQTGRGFWLEGVFMGRVWVSSPP